MSDFDIFSRFSSEVEQKPSYIHKLGAQPLKYLNIGQLLKQTVSKYPNRLALISCCEKSQITFAEALEKVNMKKIWRDDETKLIAKIPFRLID